MRSFIYPPMNHPLSDFHFCPHCGSDAFRPTLPTGSRCDVCGFTFFPNAAAATAAIIITPDRRLLCVRRSKEPARGSLDLPGGFVDPGESLTEGLIREVKEEIDGEVCSYRFLFSVANTYPFSDHLVYTADSFFLCSLNDYNNLHAADDAAALLAVPLSEVNPEAFGLSSIREGVRTFLKMLPTLTEET